MSDYEEEYEHEYEYQEEPEEEPELNYEQELDDALYSANGIIHNIQIYSKTIISQKPRNSSSKSSKEQRKQT